jgi:hypothetical protein
VKSDYCGSLVASIVDRPQSSRASGILRFVQSPEGKLKSDQSIEREQTPVGLCRISSESIAKSDLFFKSMFTESYYDATTMEKC